MVMKLVGPQSDKCFLLFCIKAVKYSSAPAARTSPVALTRETCQCLCQCYVSGINASSEEHLTGGMGSVF